MKRNVLRSRRQPDAESRSSSGREDRGLMNQTDTASQVSSARIDRGYPNLPSIGMARYRASVDKNIRKASRVEMKPFFSIDKKKKILALN